jgi:hypothetical protein
METGLKLLQTSNIDLHTHKDLSIQIHLNGLSFCILNKSSLTIEYLHAKNFDKAYTPEMTLDALVSHLKSEDIFSQPFNEIRVTHQSDLATLVPEELFDENKLNDYLKFNTKILETDYLTFDHNESLRVHTVYIPYVNINNQLLEEFGSFDYYHAYSTLTNAFLKLPKSKEAFLHLYIHVNKGHFEFIVFDAAKQLVFCNSFDYQTKEDFIYYILFVFEQLKLDKEKDVLHITGEIDEDTALYKILFKYIRFISFIEINEIYKFDDTLKDINKHHHFLILNSFN